MSSLVVYPVGAGGSFLMSLMCGDNTIKEKNNEYVSYHWKDVKLEYPKDDYDYTKYDWFKTHYPFYMKYFNNNVVISSTNKSIREYCNLLGALKMKLNRNRDVDFRHRIQKTGPWDDMCKYSFIPYEKIFFELELNDTPFKGKETEIRTYHERNIDLIKKHNWSQYVPQV